MNEVHGELLSQLGIQDEVQTMKHSGEWRMIQKPGVRKEGVQHGESGPEQELANSSKKPESRHLELRGT